MKTCVQPLNILRKMGTCVHLTGYHHVHICHESQKYLGFEWKGGYYVFTVLPFGLASASYVFSKLLRPVVRHFRSQGRTLMMG